jgi:hypothetical protein
MPTHAELSARIRDRREPGTPEATCAGRLHRVNGAGKRVAANAAPMLDACLRREGRLDQFSEIRLWRCRDCNTTLVIATAPDRTEHQRNVWQPGAWDRDAGKPVTRHEPAVAC